MALVSANFAELMLPGLRKIYSKQMGTHPDIIPLLFNREDSKKQAESNLGMGGVQQMVKWSTSSNSVAYANYAKGFKSTYLHEKYSNGLELERELFDDDQYSEIKKRANALADSVASTRQEQATDVFNNAFNTSFAGPDAKPLCAADHPLAPGSGSVFSNVGALALTADNVEATRTLMKAWTDDKGNRLSVKPDMLIVPSALRKAARVIADSENEPNTANNDVNVWHGSLTVVELDLLDDSNNWFMADKRRMKRLLNWYDRRKAILETDKVFDTEVLKYKVVGRWSYGWDDPTFIYGHNPA